LLAGVWTGNSNGAPMSNSTGVSGAAPIWHTFMEMVMADEEMLELLGVPPNDPAAWDFVPPPTVEKLPDCPPRLTCRVGGEYFDRAWLQAAGGAGPLADSFISEPTAAVHRNKYSEDPGWPIYCADPAGKERKLLRLYNSIGLTQAAAPATVSATSGQNQTIADRTTATRSVATEVSSLPIVRSDDNKVVVMFYPDNELERYRKVRWSLARGMAVNLGPCATLQFYTVQPGDYWGRLGERFGLSLADLQGINPQMVRAEGILQPGDKLLIPSGVAIEIGDGSGEEYTVQSGDTWMGIAQSFNIPLRLLQSVNSKIVRPYSVLQPGDKVFIPQLNQPELLSQIR